MILDPKPKSKLEIAIDEILFQMGNQPPDSSEYGKLLERVEKLHKMKENEKPSRVTPDTWVLAATNLIGIAVIVHHEHINVITSKALSFVQRPR
jgi:hypothetical protein